MFKKLISDKGLVAIIDRGDQTYDIGVAASERELAEGDFYAYYSRIPEENVRLASSLETEETESAGREVSATTRVSEVFHPESGKVYVTRGPGAYVVQGADQP